MKKLLIATLAAFICVPAFAQPNHHNRAAAKNIKAPVQAGCHGRKAFTGSHHRRGLAQADRGPQGDFRQARQAHRAHLRAQEARMEKMVGDYNKMKAGKKKDAKLREIRQEVRGIHDRQLDFKRDQLGKFEKRLDHMRKDFDRQAAPDRRDAWVNRKTDELIRDGGKMGVLFSGEGQGPKAGNGPQQGGHGPQTGNGPQMGGGMQGPQTGNGPQQGGHGPVAELPVERPVPQGADFSEAM